MPDAGCRPRCSSACCSSACCSSRLVWRESAGGDIVRTRTGSAACKGCHGKIVDSFVRTAHFNTSAPADSHSIKGHFTAGQNDLRTARKGVHFRMESSGGVFNQTAFDHSLGQSRTERFDLVIGSGRVGQSYLYWSGALLFQLPVSYLTGTDEWINSPGYSDGQIDFGRFVPPPVPGVSQHVLQALAGRPRAAVLGRVHAGRFLFQVPRPRTTARRISGLASGG